MAAAAGLSWLLHSARHVLLYPKPKVDVSDRHSTDHDDQVKNWNGARGGPAALSADREMYPSGGSGFQMPLHYPRYTKEDYEKMEEWKVDMLLKQYGLAFQGTLDQKRAYAMGAFLWPHQY